MRKPIFLIVLVLIIVTVFVAFLYYEDRYAFRDPSLSSRLSSSTSTAEKSNTKLPFNDNDNLDQALDDLKTLDLVDIQ